MDTAILGYQKVRVKVVYAYDKTSVMKATTIANEKLCGEIEPDIYECDGSN